MVILYFMLMIVGERVGELETYYKHNDLRAVGLWMSQNKLTIN